MKQIYLAMLCVFAIACVGDIKTENVCLVCAANAVCDAAGATECNCTAGFTGDGTASGTGCKDIDECAAGIDLCTAPHQACINTAGSFTCGCAFGFADDGTAPGTGCSDIDECATGTSTCGASHGTCANTVGSFTCGCVAGFAGDGTASGTGCSDIDECTAGTSTCDNFSCTNTEGAFQCDGLYGIEAFEGLLFRLDPVTFGMLDLVPITSSVAILGITAMARHPRTGVVYAVAKINGARNTPRAFGTLDVSSGAFTVIGSPVDLFSSLAFLPDGTLYAQTGRGAVVPHALHTIDLATGIATLVGAVEKKGISGEVICYDSDAQRMYHWSAGDNITDNALVETLPLAPPLTTTSVSAGLAGVGEVLSCRYVGDHTFLVHDLNSNVRFVTSAGVVSLVPNAVTTLFDDVRATLSTTMTVPHTVRPSKGRSIGGTTVTIRGIGLTGATKVKFGASQAAWFTVVNDTTITAVTPAAATATVNVTVEGPLRYRATWPTSYEFVASLNADTRTTTPSPEEATTPTVSRALERKALRGR